MTIIRTAKDADPYARINNTTLRDTRLSWKARGLLAYLLSMPDNWQTRTEHLVNQSPDGEAAVRSGLRELEAAGYLDRSRMQREGGRFEWEITVRETAKPQVAPSGDFPHVDDPHVDNPVVGNRSLRTNQLEEQRKKNNPSPHNACARTLLTDEWERRKAAGVPVPTNYPAAMKALERLLAAGHPPERIAAALKTASTITDRAMELELNRERSGRRDPRPQAEIIAAAASKVEARRAAGVPSLFALPGGNG